MKAYGSVARPADAAYTSGSVGSGRRYLEGDAHAGHSNHGSRGPVFRGLPAVSVESAPAAVAVLDPDGSKQRPAVRVLIVDDCILYRYSLAGALTSSGIRVVGFAWDLATVVRAIRESAVDIALVNIATADSAALVGVALATDPQLRVVVLGVPDDDESGVIACAEAGVAGYHTRTESFDDLLELVDKVAAGQSVCSPRVSAILMRRLSALAARQSPAPKGLVLTAREDQILGMLTQGLSNRDIALQLSIAVHTVKNHVHSLLTKLGVSSRAQAVALAQTMRYDIVMPENQFRTS